ncbi:LysR family transcriptional regulator [Bordetella sp. FB-8]|uniref:LysR family transcriptional regulator n=1 Tax=Bordetella sp. FB-8 TaxID=1159870 RepID=UPI0003707F99|nr:LysR family transcriptional regulator [Bordetella sp. FB-8]
MSDPDLNLLIAFDALLAEGSVAGAALRLGLSASAMSRAVTRLREATGDPLLVRAGRRMVPTPHAQALRQRVRDAAREARAVLNPPANDFDISALRRTFTIRSNDGFVEAFGAQLITAAAAVAPGVRLRFAPKSEKTAAPLREGVVDLEIGVLSQMGPEVRVQALFRDRFIGVARKGHPLEAEPAVTAGQYVAFGHVVASRRGRADGPVDVALADMGLERTVAAVVPNFSAALAVARGSDLIALVPAFFLGAQQEHVEPARTGIFAFELPVQTEKITVSQMWHPRLGADPGHQWLRQLVLEVCRENI